MIRRNHPRAGCGVSVALADALDDLDIDGIVSKTSAHAEKVFIEMTLAEASALTTILRSMQRSEGSAAA